MMDIHMAQKTAYSQVVNINMISKNIITYKFKPGHDIEALFLFFYILGACVFVQIPSSECPSDSDLAECTSNMATGSLCEADQTLPDGTSNFNVDNCPGGYDVFRCTMGTCAFAQIPSSECPSDSDLSECTSNMATGSLCEADQTLPDGTSNFDVDNCPGGYDVFRCTWGTKPIIDITSSYQLSLNE